MKARRKSRNISTLSLTSAPNGVGGQRHVPVAIPPGKRRVTHFTGGLVGRIEGVDGE